MAPLVPRVPAFATLLLVVLCVGTALGQTKPAPPKPLQPPRPLAAPAPAFGGFGGFDLWSLSSGDSFEELFGTTQVTGFNIGGEGRNLWKGLFVRGSYARSSEQGERVFIDDAGRVYPLGIPLTVTLQPIEVSAGWRVPVAKGRVSPYGGGGMLWVQYQEESDFADASENVDETHMGFLFYGGAEFALVRYLALAVEGQYRVVNDAIGEGGVSALYGDTSLGGASLVVRVVVANDILQRRRPTAPARAPKPTPPTRPSPPAVAPTPTAAPTTPAPSPAPPVSDVTPALPINEMPPGWLPGHVAPEPPYEAEVEVWIDATGAVGQVRIVRSTNRKYDYYVRLAAMNWRYRPAMQQGKPVPSRRVVNVRIKPGA